MFIKKIYDFDEDSGEAYLIVSDGTYDILCFCALYQNELQMLPAIEEVRTFLCDSIIKSDVEKYLIVKKNDYYSYHLQGKVLDIDKNIVSVGDIIIKLDTPIPKDIKNSEYIEFNVFRLDCSIL